MWIQLSLCAAFTIKSLSPLETKTKLFGCVTSLTNTNKNGLFKHERKMKKKYSLHYSQRMLHKEASFFCVLTNFEAPNQLYSSHKIKSLVEDNFHTYLQRTSSILDFVQFIYKANVHCRTQRDDATCPRENYSMEGVKMQKYVKSSTIRNQ